MDVPTAEFSEVRNDFKITSHLKLNTLLKSSTKTREEHCFGAHSVSFLRIPNIGVKRLLSKTFQ